MRSSDRVIDIEAVRERFVTRAILILAWLSPIPIGVALYRLPQHGWQPITILDFVFPFILILAAVFRNRISYQLRAWFLLAPVPLIGLAGLYSYGLVGAGLVVLCAFPVLIALAFGFRTGLISAIMCLVGYTLIGVSACLGNAQYQIDLAEYAVSPTAWIIGGVTYLMTVFVVVLSYGTIHSHLIKSLKQLRESRAIQDSLVDSLTDSFLFSRDATGRFNWVSESISQVLGYKPDEFLASYPDLLIENAGDTADGDGQKPGRLSREMQFLHKDGLKRWLSFHESAVTDERGVLTGTEGIAHNITETRYVFEELRKFALVIEQSSEIVVITDTNGDITYVNPAFEEITGFSFEEALGQNPRILKSGLMESNVYTELWQTITSGGTWRGRLINKRKDETIYTEEAAITPLKSPTGETISYVAVKHDISDELELKQQLLQSQKMEAVGQLAGGIAHDFNNMLQVIHGYSQMVLEECDNPVLKQNLGEVLKASERAISLVRQLLAFSRKQVLELTDLDLGKTLGELANMIRRVIGEHISLHYKCEPGLKLMKADKGQIEQVLINLCVNARDAMPDGGMLAIEAMNEEIDEKFCETHNWASAGSYVVLSVTDTGTGMDQDTLTRIFEPFFTTKASGRGTGLGLSTVFGIVRQHGGLLNVFSEVGVGTTFRIYLPQSEQEASTEDRPVVRKASGGSETVLLADDDDAVREVTRMILEKSGYRVIDAGDGEEALLKFQTHSEEIDMALLDVVMPKMGGKVVSAEIRKISPELPVLFASGYNREDFSADMVLDTNTRVVSKPYEKQQLLGVIREILDQADLVSDADPV